MLVSFFFFVNIVQKEFSQTYSMAREVNPKKLEQTIFFLNIFLMSNVFYEKNSSTPNYTSIKFIWQGQSYYYTTLIHSVLYLGEQ
jgi:hypothetical protein